jgi:hypothetical protein
MLTDHTGSALGNFTPKIARCCSLSALLRLVQEMRRKLAHLEKQLRPLVQLAARLDSVTPPDNGSLADWMELMKRRQLAAAAGGAF